MVQRLYKKLAKKVDLADRWFLLQQLFLFFGIKRFCGECGVMEQGFLYSRLRGGKPRTIVHVMTKALSYGFIGSIEEVLCQVRYGPIHNAQWQDRCSHCSSPGGSLKALHH